MRTRRETGSILPGWQRFDSDACSAALTARPIATELAARMMYAGVRERTNVSGREAFVSDQRPHASFRPRHPASRRMKALRAGSVIFAMLLAVPFSGCAALKLGVMNHAGPVAASQWHLYVIVGIVLIFVAGPVLLLTPLIAWHYRLSNKHSAFRPSWNFSWTLEGLIWIPPAAIVVGLGFVLWHYTLALDPFRPIASDQPALEVQAVGLDWKWLFIYPDQGIATVNQLSIPVDRPVHITLTSGTVMQALLIPQLAGQIYAMAGMTTQLNLAASRPGIYRGANTQFNGTGFQNQKFNVTALPPADYDRWVTSVRASAHPLDGTAYAELLRQSSPPQPIAFSSVPQHLFDTIMAQSQEPR